MDSITIGCTTYSKADAIAIMQQPVAKDMTYALAQQLIAAKLNIACLGTDSSCISRAISDADNFLCTRPVGSGVKARVRVWKTALSLVHSELSSYNEGLLCAPSGD